MSSSSLVQALTSFRTLTSCPPDETLTRSILTACLPLLPSARSETVANSLLDRYKKENGRYPEAMALVLWGLDNIKTQGEGVAQALWLLGVRPVRDALNRTTSVEAIPLAELGRPRIDVVMTVSGIFRDLFSPTVQLLDKAVRLVAQLDEPLDRTTYASTFCNRSSRMPATRTTLRFVFSQTRPAITART